jgi:hypothetical protein
LCYDKPFVIGTGRLLAGDEANVLLAKLQVNDSAKELSAYREASRDFTSLLEKGFRGNRPGITVYELHSTSAGETLFTKGQSPGSKLYYVCFDCNEGVPASLRVEKSRKKGDLRKIWVLSGRIISIDMPKRQSAWRMLLASAAE